VQTNINVESSKLSGVQYIVKKKVKNIVNLQFEKVISKNHSLKLDENQNIQDINVYNAVELLKINNDDLYHKTKSEINYFLFNLDKINSENVGILF